MNRSYLLYKDNKFLWNKIYFFIEYAQFLFFDFLFFLSIEISITSIIKIERNRVKLHKITIQLLSHDGIKTFMIYASENLFHLNYL